MRHGFRVLAIALTLAGFVSPALAQSVDVNPDTCEEAQAVDLDPDQQFELELIDADDEGLRSDRDYFRYRAEPGKRLTIEANFWAIDPTERTLVQVLDEQCNELLSNLGHRGFDFFDFQVPASGEFVVGIADPEDFTFSGDGNGLRQPAYIFRILAQGPRVDSITVRVIDAETGHPIPGTEGPLARVRVTFCANPNLCLAARRGAADALGAFRVTADPFGSAIRSGPVEVSAVAQGYEPATVQLQVAEGEAASLDIALTRSEQE